MDKLKMNALLHKYWQQTQLERVSLLWQKLARGYLEIVKREALRTCQQDPQYRHKAKQTIESYSQ